jgi:Zn-dependent M28 family amino/carboxypeptidase
MASTDFSSGRGACAARSTICFAWRHYDCVPGTPAADDDASAVGVCVECARLIGRHNIGSVTIKLRADFFAKEATKSLLKGAKAHI